MRKLTSKTTDVANPSGKQCGGVRKRVLFAWVELRIVREQMGLVQTGVGVLQEKGDQHRGFCRTLLYVNSETETLFSAVCLQYSTWLRE